MDKAQTKFKLTVSKNEDWITLTSMIINNWRCWLEEDPEVNDMGQWVGFYCDGMDDLPFVLPCAMDFIPYGMQQ